MTDYLLTDQSDAFACYDTDVLDHPRLFGLAGDDSVFAQGSSYREFGGAGNDTLIATYHFDGVASYSDFNDIGVYGGKGDDTIYLMTTGSLGGFASGDAGNDFMGTNGFGAQLLGGNGFDTMYSVGADNVLFGGNGADVAIGCHVYDQIMGGNGNDFLAVVNQLGNPYTIGGGAQWCSLEGDKGADTFRIELDDTATQSITEVKDYSARQGDVLAVTLNGVSYGDNRVEMNGQQLFTALDHNGDHTLTAADGNDGSGFYVDQTGGNYPSLNLHVGGNEVILDNVTHLDFIV